MSLLMKTEPKQCELSTGGVKSIFITNRNDVLSLLYTDDNFNIVTGLQYPGGSEAFFINFDTNDGVTTLTDTLEKNNGDLYRVEINTNLVRIDEAKRGFLEELHTNPVLVVIQDRNSKFWIVGFDAPLRMRTYEGETDTAGGVSQYSFSINGKSRFKMRELSAAAAAGLNILTNDCGQFAGAQVSATTGTLAPFFDCFVNDFY
jgi:hypothetical protein